MAPEPFDVPRPPAIRVSSLSRTFGVVTALQNVNLEIREGEFVALLGASGCGKSSLLRLIAGLDTPSQGEIQVLGGSPAKALQDRVFGIVFQDPALFPWRTVRQNVALPAEVFRDAAVRDRVEEWIQRVGLQGFEKALPHQLSGGMRSRVAIARALVFHPRILMMDEPFGALDEITRLEMHRQLLALCAEVRPATVFVTHSIVEALFLADRVVVMSPRPGRIRSEVVSPFPRPRPDRLRVDPEFIRLQEQLFDLLSGDSLPVSHSLPLPGPV